ETGPDGSTTYTEAVRVTYRQEWTAYNKAQTTEEEWFGKLLRELCEKVPQPRQDFGRPRLPKSDVVFALATKVYGGMSGRRNATAVRECKDKGLIDKAPHYNSAFRYLEDETLTPILKSLIEQSAAPLSAIESDFAVDSSGFSTSVYDRWFDHKYGRQRSENVWVKAHLMCGVKTHVVTSVEVTPTETADEPHFKPLVESTASRFTIGQVSGDKAYNSHRNLQAVQAVGGSAYIPFKSNTNGAGRDPLWNRLWHFYNFNRSIFLAQYHKRSNVETAFSMIKAKFGTHVRAKMPIAQVNEVLLKVLCHNICVLIQSMYELGIEPSFSTAA
ncbi:MAG: IS4/IS5 family transposase, partial [Dehalococcoidia bacterium]|nr:IS4/IS5 family transposase [Dehalococcoidia bacterium]